MRAMLREIDLIRLLLSYHAEWEQNPEAFLELTILISSIDSRCISSGEIDVAEIMGPKLDNVAKVLMGITHVNLGKFKDFADLKQRGHATTHLGERLVEILETFNNIEYRAAMESVHEGRHMDIEQFFQDPKGEKLFLKLWPYITPVEE